MTTILNRQAFPIGPTPTDITLLDVRDTRFLAVSVTNLDGVQTVDGTVLSAVWAGDDLGPTSISDLAAIAPGETRPVTLDCDTRSSIQLRFTASGAGCNIRVSAKPDGGRRG